MPASFKASLYFIIAATASADGTQSAPALSYPLGIISIMNRMSRLRFFCSRACRHDDHPRHAETVGDHAKARREEGLAQRHLHLSAVGERAEQTISVGLVFRVQN